MQEEVVAGRSHRPLGAAGRCAPQAPGTGEAVRAASVRCRENYDVAQVGEGGQAGLGVVVAGHTGKRGQGHLAHAAALVGRQLELGLGAHLGRREHLELLLGRDEHSRTALRVGRLRQVLREPTHAPTLQGSVK